MREINVEKKAEQKMKAMKVLKVMITELKGTMRNEREKM